MPTTWNDSRNSSPSTSTMSVSCSARRASSSDAGGWRCCPSTDAPRAARSPSKPALATSTPWHPASTQPSVGSSRIGEVGARAARAARANTMPSPLNSSRTSSALVEHERDVVGALDDGSCVQLARPGAAAPRGRPSCRPSRGRAARRPRRAAPRCRRWRARCRGGRRARRAGRDRAAVRTTMLCADAVDGERRRALAQARLDQVGELGLVVALRPHRDQRGR